MSLPNPIADEVGDGYAAFWVRQGDAVLSRPVAAFLELCRTDGLRPVIITSQAAQVSAALAREFDERGAHWGFAAPDGAVYDGTSGLAIRGLAELWDPPAGPRPAHEAYRYRAGIRQAGASLELDLCARSAGGAGDAPLAFATAVMEALEVEPQTVGDAEPGLAAWDRERLVAEFDAQAAEAQRLVVGFTTPGSMTVDVRSGPEGRVERVRATVDIDIPYGSVTYREVERSAAALRWLASAFTMTSGLVSVIEAHRAGRRAQAVAEPLPLAVYAGGPLAEAFQRRVDSTCGLRAEWLEGREQRGLLAQQSVDTAVFSALAREVSASDPTPQWVIRGDPSPEVETRPLSLLQRLRRKREA